ncbi:cyclic di-AMP binding protein CbpA [Rummeliibacillus pycnus]|uniref:cyclic di-AMP binding protein CbpA n=1 Tax=Rummeliibacillus pycnus TaxID=101070 RepID=UPI000C998681|nr:cyclic di-AMP binding protein CbpA [Rummeliibacillus pycnus]
MIVKQRYVKKNDVVFCTETDLASSVLEKLHKSGYRCIPILDKNKEKFIGNAYKVEILEYQKKHDHQDIQISELAIDKDGIIDLNSSFYKVFLKIKWLPYLAVTDEQGKFCGILTHSKVFDLLEEAWGYKTGSCALTIAVPVAEGILVKTLLLIRKIWPVHSVFSIDDDDWYLRRVIITLDKGAKKQTVKEIESNLHKVGARLVDVEIFNQEEFESN